MVGVDIAGFGADPGAHPDRPVGVAAVERVEAGPATLLSRRTLRPAARCRIRAVSVRSTVQAFETEGLIGTGAAAAVLAYLFHRIERPSRRSRRRCSSLMKAGSRSTTTDFAGQLARMAEDAAQEERLRHLRHAVALGHRRLSDCAGHHRELSDPHIAAERARDRAADHGDLSPLWSQRPADRAPAARRHRSAITTASPPRQSDVRNWAWAKSRSPSPPLLPRPIRRRSNACSQNTAGTASYSLGSRHRGASWATDLIPNLSNLETSL